jgi:putative oxidoreductase
MHRLLTAILSSRSGSDAVPLAARLVAGLVFVAFSMGKFFRHDAESSAFEDYGVPFADVTTYLVGLVELGGGLMLVLGLGTRLAALALTCNMAVAISTAGRIEGGPIHLILAPALLATMLLLLWLGPGRRSLDARLLDEITGSDPVRSP